MEYMEYIVRADYYPDGEIIPLGITDCHGNSMFVNKIIETIRTDDNVIRIKCSTNAGELFMFSFAHDRWTVRRVL